MNLGNPREFTSRVLTGKYYTWSVQVRNWSRPICRLTIRGRAVPMSALRGRRVLGGRGLNLRRGRKRTIRCLGQTLS
jgi:hypothetical protein